MPTSSAPMGTVFPPRSSSSQIDIPSAFSRLFMLCDVSSSLSMEHRFSIRIFLDSTE